MACYTTWESSFGLKRRTHIEMIESVSEILVKPAKTCFYVAMMP
jgi:hypothetical protein